MGLLRLLMYVGCFDGDDFGHEWDRHGSEWADTLGKWSHGLQEGFEMPPVLLGCHIKFKNG